MCCKCENNIPKKVYLIYMLDCVGLLGINSDCLYLYVCKIILILTDFLFCFCDGNARWISEPMLTNCSRRWLDWRQTISESLANVCLWVYLHLEVGMLVQKLMKLRYVRALKLVTRSRTHKFN